MDKAIKIADDVTSLNGKLPNIVARYIRYSIGTIIPTAIDLFILISLVEILKVYYLFAAVFSFIFSQTSSYFINRKWSFRGTKTRHLKGYSYFILFNTVSFLVSLSLFAFAVEELNIYYIYARILVGVIGGLINFFFHYFITFKIKKIKWTGKR